MTVWAFFERYGQRIFENGKTKYDMYKLSFDQFYLNVISQGKVTVYEQHRDCVECDYQTVSDYAIGSTNYRYKIETKGKECIFEEGTFGEFGIYNVTATNCKVVEIREPVNIYFPILTVFLIYLLLFAVIYLIHYFFSKRNKENEESGKKNRMKSLDVFKGITIIMMIFANYGSGGYFFIEHAAWNGLHVADLIFPWFMWIMGVVIPITLSSKLTTTDKTDEIDRKVILKDVGWRSIKLICLGIFLGSGTNLFNLRVMGVLQRFGVAYFAVSAILIFLLEDESKFSTELKKHFKDILVLWKGWLFVLGIIFLYLLLIFLVHEPGCPAGYLGPGGLHKNSSYIDCVGGATGYIDRSILTSAHVYQYPTAQDVFLTNKPFDPEGLLGCLPTIFHVFLGVQAGSIYRMYKKNEKMMLIRWLTWSVGTGLLGGVLCLFSKDDGPIPVNKNLWSLSFVLVTSCFAFFLLSLLYFVIDVGKKWSGKPFLFAGMNSIALYAGHELLDNHFPIRWSYMNTEDEEGNWRKTHFVALFSDSWATLMWLLVSYIMYKKKIFITV